MVSGHRYRQSAVLCVLVVLLLGVGVACSDSEAERGFCDATASALKDAVKDVMKGPDTFDESAFVADLRAIDLTDLIDADRQAFTAAIKEVESAFFESRGGWTTEPVATVAARLCTQEMPVISAVP